MCTQKCYCFLKLGRCFPLYVLKFSLQSVIFFCPLKKYINARINEGKKKNGKEKNKLKVVPDLAESLTRLRVGSITLLILDNLSNSNKDQANSKVVSRLMSLA